MYEAPSYSRVFFFFFSFQSGEPLIAITLTPKSNKLTIGATVILTCTASQPRGQTSEETRPRRIEWFDPQKIRKRNCLAETPPAAFMNCTLKVDTLTEAKIGNYTCRARNKYNLCSTKEIQISPQGK